MLPLRTAPLALVCALVLTSCGNGAEDGAEGRVPAAEVYELAPVPEGGGGEVPDDVNGDGYPDLLFLGPVETAEGSQGQGWEQARRLVVVYGSRKGPEPTTRTGLAPGAVSAVAAVGGGQRLRAGTADLDGDGFADIPVATSPASPLGVGQAAVLWGGPTGPDPDADPTPVAFAGSGEGADEGWSPSGAAPVPGDFDGDGHADLASWEASSAGDASRLAVLFGPFDREGVPDRGGRRAIDERVGALVPAPVGGGGATPLLVRRGDDGEQPANTLLLTGADDPREWGQARLHAGGMSVFGDFDGDGETDLAVGDDGGRNNEPGHGTEKPEVDDKLNVYHGPFDPAADALEPSAAALPGSGESYGAFRSLGGCDLDGDGADTLAVGLEGHGVDLVDGSGPEPVVGEGDPLVRPSGATGSGGGPQVAHVFACADHDADGADELVLYQVPKADWSAPLRWWVTDGAEDEAAFDGAGFED